MFFYQTAFKRILCGLFAFIILIITATAGGKRQRVPSSCVSL